MPTYSEAGRWYDVTTGKCVLEIPKAKQKKGEPIAYRKPTIRDAIVDGEVRMLPSVTTILKVVAKPGLTEWIRQQAILAAATCPRLPGESDADWLKKVLGDADEERDLAASTGKDFHSAADNYWKTGNLDNDDPAIANFLRQLADWRKAAEVLGWGDWKSEFSYIVPANSFAGTADLIAMGSGKRLVVDYKTCDFSKLKPNACPCYDEHVMQVSAPAPDVGANIYVDRNTGDIRTHWWSDADLKRGRNMFCTALTLWEYVNRWEERKVKAQ